MNSVWFVTDSMKLKREESAYLVLLPYLMNFNVVSLNAETDYLIIMSNVTTAIKATMMHAPQTAKYTQGTTVQGFRRNVHFAVITLPSLMRNAKMEISSQGTDARLRVRKK